MYKPPLPAQQDRRARAWVCTADISVSSRSTSMSMVPPSQLATAFTIQTEELTINKWIQMATTNDQGYCWVLYGNGIVHISQVIGHSTQTWNRRMVYHWSKSIDPGVLNFESCQSCPYVQVIRTERLSDAVNRWFLTQLVQVFDILCGLLCVCVRWKL